MAKRLVPGAAVHRCTMNGLSAFVGDLPIAALSKHRQSTTPGLVKPPSGYQGTVTLVILSASATCRILASPTTEPGRRGWKRRLGSPLSAPHFFARTAATQAIQNRHFRVSPVLLRAPCGSSSSLRPRPPMRTKAPQTSAIRRFGIELRTGN